MRILPDRVGEGVRALDPERLYEIRLRCGQPAVLRYGERWRFLARYGLTDAAADALAVTERDLSGVLMRASDYSLYTVNRQLCESYVTVEGGVRIGVCGEPVIESGRILTVKNFNALVIRVPHAVPGASRMIPLKKCSTLIIGTPGSGKTTFLRDYAKRYSEQFLTPTVIVDERAEIAACAGGKALMDVGLSETISLCDKRYGFRQALRVLRPEMLITDELTSREDLAGAASLIGGGVHVTASLHARSLEEARKRMRGNCLFRRFAVLDDGDRPGVVREIREIDL